MRSKFFKKISFLSGLLLTFQGSVSALLPPLWEGVAEIKSILNDKRLGNHLESGEVLMEIKKEEKGWRIVTNKSELFVKVISQPMNRPGPLQYQLEFENLD